MIWLVDTNVISELGRKLPNKNVVEWFTSVPKSDLAVSVVSMAEIRFGVESLSDAVKQSRYAAWLDEAVRPLFTDRTLGITEDILVVWQSLALKMRRQKRTLPQSDSLLAATALHLKLKVCTRDTKPFELCGVATFNPWTGKSFNGA